MIAQQSEFTRRQVPTARRLVLVAFFKFRLAPWYIVIGCMHTGTKNLLNVLDMIERKKISAENNEALWHSGYRGLIVRVRVYVSSDGWSRLDSLSLALSPYLSLTCVHITTTTKPIDASSWLLIKRSRKMKIQITLSGLLSRMCWTTISGKVQKWQPFFVLGTLTCTQMDMRSSVLSLLWSQLNRRINKFISREKVMIV